VTYDLRLTLRDSVLTADVFAGYFGDREHWALPDDEPGVAAYYNGGTGVYFHVRHVAPGEQEPAGALWFALAVYRPPVFALEADLELEALVGALDLAVEDRQADGITGDVYDRTAFLRGWTVANRAAHAAALADGVEPRVLAGKTLERVWRWNHERERTEEANGGFYLAPWVGFVEATGRVQTIFVFEVGQNMLVPRTDLVDLTTDDGASVVIAWDALETALDLAPDTAIDQPLDYWAILDTLADAPLRALLATTASSIDVVPLTLDRLHAREDVPGRN